MNTLLKEDAEMQANEGFKVNSLETANWCFRKIRALKNRIDENKMLADSERIRIDNWEKETNKTDLDSIFYLESLLKEYFINKRAEDKKFKLTTPSGQVIARKITKWNYQNEEKLISYLKENEPTLIRVKEEVNKTDLKKKFKDGINKETGEIIPGVEITEEQNISVRVD